MLDVIVDIQCLADDAGYWVVLACDGHDIEKCGPFPNLAEAKIAAEEVAKVAETIAVESGGRVVMTIDRAKHA